MEFCNRNQSSERTWLLLAGAALGTALLVFVPSDAWLAGRTAATEALFAILLKQFLTALLLLIVPSLWARLAHTVSPWMLIVLTVFAFGCGLVFGGGAETALFGTLLCALPGAGLYGLQTLKLTNFRTVIYSSFVNLVALFCFACLPSLIRHGDAYRSFRHAADLLRVLVELQQQGADPAIDQTIAEEMKYIADLLWENAESLCISTMLMPAMAAGLSNTLFSHLWNRNRAVKLNSLPPFAEWRCERGFAFVATGFLAVTLLLGMFGVQTAGALSGVADTLWRLPCMLAGLCVIRWLGLRFNRGWVFWIAVALLIITPPLTGMFLAVIGMYASIRRSMKVREDGVRK